MSSRFGNDTEFQRAVAEVLEDIEDQLDTIEEGELDSRLIPGSLTVTFEDDSVLMLSQQTPTHELWLSANYTAWHFVCRDGTWFERDTNEPMMVVLSELFSQKLSMVVSFS